MTFAFVQRHTTDHAVNTLCRVRQVSKADYHAWAQRAPSARAAADAVLSEQIPVIHAASRRTYGSPRIHAELAAQGQAHGGNRIARLMRRHDWRAKTRRRRCVTTDSRHAQLIAPNVVDLASRHVIGWAMRHTLEGAITYDARRRTGGGVRVRRQCSSTSKRGIIGNDGTRVLVS